MLNIGRPWLGTSNRARPQMRWTDGPNHPTSNSKWVNKPNNIIRRKNNNNKIYEYTSVAD